MSEPIFNLSILEAATNGLQEIDIIRSFWRPVLTWNEGNVLFNNTLNTFYLWLYGVGNMVKDHSGRKDSLHQSWSTQWKKNNTMGPP